MMIVVVLVFACLLGVYGVVTAVAARKLWTRNSSGGIWAAVICVTWIPLGLLPLDAYGLYALLRPAVRDAWLPTGARS